MDIAAVVDDDYDENEFVWIVAVSSLFDVVVSYEEGAGLLLMPLPPGFDLDHEDTFLGSVDRFVAFDLRHYYSCCCCCCCCCCCLRAHSKVSPPPPQSAMTAHSSDLMQEVSLA